MQAVIAHEYGAPDVLKIEQVQRPEPNDDEALVRVFATYPVDPTHLAISGFSDGASYALSLGLANADLFTHIVAFSPGFVIYTRRVADPVAAARVRGARPHALRRT